MSFSVLFAHDSGTSTGKACLVPLKDNVPLIKYQKTTQIATLGNLGKVDAIPGDGLGVLRSPEKFAGEYGKRAVESEAKPHRDANIYQQPIYFLYHFGILADLLESFNIEENAVIEIQKAAVGFTVSHINQGEYVRDILLNKGNPWTVKKTGGKQYLVRYHNVVFNSQPFFMALDQIFQWENGSLRANRGKRLFQHGPLLFLDWGSNSIDKLYVPSTFRKAKGDCSMRGTFDLLSELRELAYRELHQNGTEYQLLYELYQTGKIGENGQSINTKEFEKLLKPIMESLKEDIKLFLSTLPAPPYILWCGGGGVIRGEKLLQSTFQSMFSGGVEIVRNDNEIPEPIESVLRGMMKKLIIDWMREHQEVNTHEQES